MVVIGPRKTTNIFIVATALQYLCAERIVNCFECEPLKSNFLYLIKPGLKNIVDYSRWKSVEEILPPKYFQRGKNFSKYRIIQGNLEKVLKCCDVSDETIVLHAAQISSIEETNFLINGIRKNFKKATFSVRIIPDGLQNIVKHRQNLFAQYKKCYKKYLKLFFPKLDYYPIFGDKIGTDAKIVDCVYVLPDLPHEYQPSRTKIIPSLVNASGREDVGPGKALIIGQPLVSRGLIGEVDKVYIKESIEKLVSGFCRDDIIYKSHPKEKPCDKIIDNVEDLQIDYSLERYFSENKFSIIIGVLSTALYTAKLICDNKTRIVSVGLNRVVTKEKGQKDKIFNLYNSLGIDVVDV